MGGTELAFTPEKAGSGGAVDADELAPIGGAHADIFQVSGEKLMRWPWRRIPENAWHFFEGLVGI